MKNQLPKVVLAFVLVACAMFYIFTVPSMPDVIASQFRGDGYARSYMNRSFYLPYILVFGIGLPLFLAFMISVLPVLMGKRSGNQTMSSEQTGVVRSFGFWFASFMALFAAVVHRLVVRANELDPPQLANVPFLILLVGFISVTLIGVAYVIVRARPRPA